MRASSSTTRIVCRSILLEAFMRLPMPLVENRWHAAPATVVVTATPPAAPEHASHHYEPDQHKEQNRKSEAEAPRSIPAVGAVRRQLATLRRDLLSQAVRHAQVIGDDSGERAQQQNGQHRRAPEPASVPVHLFLPLE